MTRTRPSRIQDAIVGALACFPLGASIEQIEAQLNPAPSRRTLQRWLADLIDQGRLQRLGRGRASRYIPGQLVPAGAQFVHEPTPIAYGGVLIPLGEGARTVLGYVSQPLTLRKPVGYDRRLLDDYRPNQTYYLPQSVREDLLSQGRAAYADEPAGTYARRIAHRLLIDLSWNSSRLEGNTYSLLETEHLIAVGEVAAGKDAFEAQMILNHKAAIEFLMDSVDELDFNRYTLLNLHALLSDNLLDDPAASGRLRTVPVGIGQTVFVPLEGPQQIEECFDHALRIAASIQDPFEQAFFSMVHLPYLQPFVDVNKRVSRLAANIPLLRHNLCPLSFVDVAQSTYISGLLGVYELRRIDLLRDVFVWAYQRSCARYSAVRQSLGQPDPFRLRYRQRIADTIADVVRGKMSKPQAVAHVRDHAQRWVAAADRDRFIEVVENQLISLHGGNIARYRLRPSEFWAWQQIWDAH